MLGKKEAGKHNHSNIFNAIFIIFGIVLSILLILLIVNFYEGKETKDNYANQNSKLKRKTIFYNERKYESHNLSTIIGGILTDKKSKLHDLKFRQSNNIGKSGSITQKEEETIFIKQNMAKSLLNINSLKQAKSMSNTKYSETQLLLDYTKNNIISSSNLLVKGWITLRNYSSSILEYSHEDLLEYSSLVRYWAIYNCVRGTFLIISGANLRGISIIWYEAKLVIGKILWVDSTKTVSLHQLIENDGVLAFYLIKFKYVQFSSNQCQF